MIVYAHRVLQVSIVKLILMNVIVIHVVLVLALVKIKLVIIFVCVMKVLKVCTVKLKLTNVKDSSKIGIFIVFNEILVLVIKCMYIFSNYVIDLVNMVIVMIYVLDTIVTVHQNMVAKIVLLN